MSKNTSMGEMIIGGVKRPFHINSLRQTETFTERLGMDLDEYWAILSSMTDGKALTNKKLLVNYIWSALYAGSIRTDRRCTFTYDDVLDWYEDAESDVESATEMMKPLMMLYEIMEDALKKTADVPTATVTAIETVTPIDQEKETMKKLKKAFK